MKIITVSMLIYMRSLIVKGGMLVVARLVVDEREITGSMQALMNKGAQAATHRGCGYPDDGNRRCLKMSR